MNRLLAPMPAALVVVGLAFLTDSLVYAMLPPLLPEYARIHGLNQTELGVLFGSYAGALLLATLPLGTWADRSGRRGPFLGGLVGLGAATVLFAGAGSFALLLLARVFQGVAAAATWVAGMALLADHFPAGQRGKAMSVVFAGANLGMFLGLAFASAALAAMFTSPLVGHWVDRRGAVPPLRLGLVLGAALLLAAPFLPGRGAVYPFMLALGSTCSLLMSPCSPAVSRLVERKGGTAYGSVFSLLNITFSLGIMVGPMLGSVLADLVGLRAAMALLAAGFVCYLAPLAACRTADVREAR